MTPAEAAVTGDAIQSRTIPGDAFVDPLIRRGEDIEAMERAGLTLADVERDELESIKALAHARINHLADFPLARDSAEESAQDLAQERERDAANILEAVVGFIDRHGAQAAELVLTLAAGAIKR